MNKSIALTFEIYISSGPLRKWTKSVEFIADLPDFDLKEEKLLNMICKSKFFIIDFNESIKLGNVILFGNFVSSSD